MEMKTVAEIKVELDKLPSEQRTQYIQSMFWIIMGYCESGKSDTYQEALNIAYDHEVKVFEKR